MVIIYFGVNKMQDLYFIHNSISFTKNLHTCLLKIPYFLFITDFFIFLNIQKSSVYIIRYSLLRV